MATTTSSFLPSLTLLLYCLLGIAGSISAKPSRHRELQFVSTGEAQQPYRTAYHFQPEKNWISDPSGPMYYNGVYHLFYQYNPRGPIWGSTVWAHSVSSDLINWVKLPYAIYPTEPFDIRGCLAGSATILPGNHPVILYTGINSEGLQVQNYAVPVDEKDPYLIRWRKSDRNPIIYPGKRVDGRNFRNPTTAWFEGGHWKILIGGRRKHRGIMYLYRSRDFVYWMKARHPFYDVPMADALDCPDFFPVSKSSKEGMDTSARGKNVKHVMKVTLNKGKFDYYTIGSYHPENEKYVLDSATLNGWNGLRLDHGNFHHSSSFFDPSKKRRILWGWAHESNPPEVDKRKGWAGIQAIPRTVWLDNDGKQLLQWPVEELEQLRTQLVDMRSIMLKQRERIEVMRGVAAAQADVDILFSFSNLSAAEQFDPTRDTAQSICSQRDATVPGGVGPFGLSTLASLNLEEYTPVFFRILKTDKKMHRVVLCSDTRRSSMGTEFYKEVYAGFVDVDLSEKKLSLRTLIDHSVVESFGAGGKTCILTRAYPTLAVNDNVRLYVFNNGTEAIKIVKLSAWSMKSATINL